VFSKHTIMKKLEPAPSVPLVLKSLENQSDFVNLVLNTGFNDLINEINEKYYYWDKVKYLKMPENVEPQIAWVVAKVRRMNTPYKIKFGNYSFSWFLNTRIQKQLHFCDLNIGGNLESRSLIPREDKNRYLISSIMEEAIASSQIEGAVTSRKVAKEMLRKNTPPKDKSEQMIVNNYETIQKILALKDYDLTIDRIVEIHKLISTNTLTYREEEGAFRKSNDINVVDVSDGSIVHTPPGFDEINTLINDLCIFFNDDSEDVFIHPIIKASIVHFMIGFIHPFVDGNGRTARALFYWYLLKKGYWLTEYLSISKLILKSKAQYARAYQYTEIDNNDLTYFIDYKLKTMRLAFEGLREYLQRKINEKRKVTEFIKIQSINDRQALILKWFYEEPDILLTVREVQSRIGVSNQTARTDLQALAKLGYLELIKVNLKTEAFVKSEKFEDLLRQNLKGAKKDLFA
jgi:Fic family protein